LYRLDVAAWDVSLDRIRAWKPQRVFFTHFGGFDRPPEHLADLQERLHQPASDVASLLADESRRGSTWRPVNHTAGASCGTNCSR
jgi:hypothetical protein